MTHEWCLVNSHQMDQPTRLSPLLTVPPFEIAETLYSQRDLQFSFQTGWHPRCHMVEGDSREADYKASGGSYGRQERVWFFFNYCTCFVCSFLALFTSPPQHQCRKKKKKKKNRTKTKHRRVWDKIPPRSDSPAPCLRQGHLEDGAKSFEVTSIKFCPKQ